MKCEALAGLRVLVVEDEFLVSLVIEELLAGQLCEIVGPFNRVPEALVAAGSEALDFAVLDVNVAGVRVYPVAELLGARHIPFLLLSGYGQDAIPADHPEWRVCDKPFRTEALLRMIGEQVRRPAEAVAPPPPVSPQRTEPDGNDRQLRPLAIDR